MRVLLVSSFRNIRFIAIEIEIEAPLARRIVQVYSSRGQSIREVFLRRFSRSLGGARSKTPFSASLASSFSSRSSLDNFANFDRTDSFFFFSFTFAKLRPSIVSSGRFFPLRKRIFTEGDDLLFLCLYREIDN